MYIIWKGVNSGTKTGLLISELPPISKPDMRVQETHVDGRDGSVIEELGYESYDKVVKIGLRGSFNIDDIIEYFTGSGNLILSNEEDKYYKAQIIKKIDYNRLLRYRVADINFRVQPFKYKDEHRTYNITSETSYNIYNNGNIESKPIITITGSGTIEVSLNGAAKFTYTFPDGDTSVVIDSEKEDAYLSTTLKNRNMNGDFIKLNVGRNIISWTGTITRIEINNQSRWI